MTALPDEDEWSELVDAQFNRVDLVKAGANGIPFLIAKQDGASAGLLEPGFVRSLIAKAEPGSGSQEQVTMTGSPAAIAEMIHKAAQAATSAKRDDDVAKAEQSTKSQNDLPDSAFAYIEPGGKKDADGKTTPRSLRHFPVHDKTHADNAAARIAQGAKFGKEALPKVRAAQRKFGEKVSKEGARVTDAVAKDIGPDLDDGIDGMDPTVPLAEPDDMGPGDPTDPGSPAWESIDAATAQKWTSILARARVAVDLLSDREMLEAATADPDDAENACDLQDVCSAIDFAISVLAPFAVAEQSEADCGADAMAAIGKALAGFDPAPLAAVEGLCAVRKAGRVLSAANEAEIRSAAASLTKVLTTLPQAPVADDQNVTKEAAVAAEGAPTAAPASPAAETPPQAPPKAETPVAKEGAQAAAGGTLTDGQARERYGLPADGPGAPVPLAAVSKAGDADATEGKTTMQAVFDESGQLVGIVDPADITPVSGAGGKPAAPDGEPKDDGAAKPAAAPADPGDMTPQPPADAGTPAGGEPDDDVTKAATAAEAADGTITITKAELTSLVGTEVRAALDEHGASQEQVIAKQAADLNAMAQQVETLKGQVHELGEQPAYPRVFTNGAVPPPGTLRGQDRHAGGQPVDIQKARGRKAELYAADAPDQARIAKEMQSDAIDALAAMHAGR